MTNYLCSNQTFSTSFRSRLGRAFQSIPHAFPPSPKNRSPLTHTGRLEAVAVVSLRLNLFKYLKLCSCCRADSLLPSGALCGIHATRKRKARCFRPKESTRYQNVNSFHSCKDATETNLSIHFLCVYLSCNCFVTGLFTLPPRYIKPPLYSSSTAHSYPCLYLSTIPQI